MNELKICSSLFSHGELIDQLEDNATDKYLAVLLEVDSEEVHNLKEAGELWDALDEKLGGLGDTEITRLAMDISNDYHTAMHIGEAIGPVGTRYNVKYLSFMNDDRTMHSAYYPEIEFNGSMAVPQDESTKLGLKEFKEEQEAWDYARDYLLGLQKKEKTNHVS